MPIYEFDCQECAKPFEELLRSANYIDEVTCPSCGSGQVKKKMSMFASKGTGDSSSFSLGASSASSCNTGST